MKDDFIPSLKILFNSQERNLHTDTHSYLLINSAVAITNLDFHSFIYSWQNMNYKQCLPTSCSCILAPSWKIVGNS